MINQLTAPLEAVLFAAGSDGLSSDELAHILELGRDEVTELCKYVQRLYDEREAGIRLAELAGNWVFLTHSEHAEYIRRMATTPTSTSLSNAALEVLAIVAYKQPITRHDVEVVRGVQSDRVIATLVHRQLIQEVGRAEGPGRPILYGTTDVFLQTFGLRAVTDLPPLPEPEIPQDLSLFQLTPSLPRD